MENEYWRQFITEVSEEYPLFFRGYTEDFYSECDELSDEARDERWEVFRQQNYEVCSNYGIDVHSGQDKNAVIGDDPDGYVLKFSRNSDNRCEDEAIIYGKAVEEGVAQYFARCEFFETYNGIDFYLMEEVEVDEDRVSENSDFWAPYYEIEDDEKRSEWYNDNYWDEDATETSLECFENVWGDITGLRNFLEKYDINDLHQANCGWTGGYDRDVVKFIDYSGYCVDHYWD